jgi:hypothetical protein
MTCSLCENQVINKTPVYHEFQGKPITRRGLRSFHSFTNRSSKNWSISSFDAIYEHYFGRVGRPHRVQFAVAQT